MPKQKEVQSEDAQKEGQSKTHIRTIDTLHNQDKVLKESFTLFKGRSLAFLDNELSGEVTEILGTEITETVTKKAHVDNALRLSTNNGVHHEWEAHVSEDDMMRFGSTNLDLSRMHKIPFTTVIITTQKPTKPTYKNPTVAITPKIICLKDRDADKVLAEIDRKLNAGEHDSINELELIYLPLYGSLSGKTTANLLDIAVKLTPKVVKEDKQKKNKLHNLLILLTSTFVSDEELSKILEDNMRILEDSPAVRVLEDRGVRKGIQQGIQQGILQGNEETAKIMLQDGEDYSKIERFSRLTMDRILELEKELKA